MIGAITTAGGMTALTYLAALVCRAPVAPPKHYKELSLEGVRLWDGGLEQILASNKGKNIEIEMEPVFVYHQKKSFCIDGYLEIGLQKDGESIKAKAAGLSMSPFRIRKGNDLSPTNMKIVHSVLKEEIKGGIKSITLRGKVCRNGILGVHSVSIANNKYSLLEYEGKRND